MPLERGPVLRVCISFFFFLEWIPIGDWVCGNSDISVGMFSPYSFIQLYGVWFFVVWYRFYNAQCRTGFTSNPDIY